MSFRKENKIRLSYSDLALLKRELIQKGMENLFPPRKINSIYFDSEDLAMFHDSEEGVLPRKKIRVRWYEEQKFTKEIKISSIEGRYKTSEVLGNVSKISDIRKMKLFDEFYGKISPSLKVSYIREYYLLRNMRLTFDSNIKYLSLREQTIHEKIDLECVMEIKTNIDYGEDLISRSIYSQNSRFSKYCRGLLQI